MPNPWEMDFNTVDENPPAIETAPAPDVKPWEMDFNVIPDQPQPKPTVWDKPSMTNFNKMRAAFTPEAQPFASFPGMTEQDGKKQALTAYYANMNHQAIPFVYQNIDAFIEHYHGKKLSIDQAYGEVGNILNAKPDTYKPEGTTMFGQRFSDSGLSSKIGLLPTFIALGPLYDEGVQVQMATMAAASLATIKRSYQSLVRAGNKPFLELTGTMHKDEWMAEKTASLKETDKFLAEMKPFYDDNWNMSAVQTLETKGIAAGVKKMVTDLAVGSPNLVMIILSGPYAPVIMGAEAAADKYNDLDMNSSGLSETQKSTSALVNGVATGVFFGMISYAKVLGVPLTGKLISDAKSGIYAGLFDFAKKNAIQTSQPELVAATNWFTNKFLDIPNKKGLRRTLYETGVENLLPNAVFSGVGTKHFVQYERTRAKVRNTLFEERESLLEVENPTNAENKRLSLINDVLASRDMDKAIHVASFERMIDTYNQRNRERAISGEPEKLRQPKVSEDGKPVEDAAPVNPNDELTNEQYGDKVADEALREEQTLAQFGHHPDDTIQAVEDLKHGFPNAKAIAALPSQIPEAAKEQLRINGHSPENYEAFVHNGDVYFNPEKIKPQDVPKKFIEELVGHEGVRKALGKDFEPVLDQIANTPAYQKDIAVFAEKNRPDNPDHANMFDVTDEDGRRNATAEFLAHTSRLEAKPAYWKEVLFHIKQALRKIPGFRNMRLTDTELEGILSMGYREMKNQKNVDLTDSVKTGDVKFKIFKDFERYSNFLDKRFSDNKLGLEKNQRAKLEQAYKDFPIGESFTNKWGEQIHFNPKPGGDVDEYIHHFLIKRGQGGTEAYSDSHLELFKQFISNAKNPDNRILGISKNKDTGIETQSVYYVKQIHDPKGYHTIIALVEEPSSRILSWTHFDTKESYVQNKLIKPEKTLIEKYGLVDKDGNKVDLTYDEYLKRKESDIPLYLATDGGLTTSQPQAAPSSPESIISPSPEKSSPKTNIPFSMAEKPDTPAFKEWFGDSKVVDENGKPLVVYHGTNTKFNKVNFKKGAQGLFWFASDRSSIEKGESGAQGTKIIMELYASIKNPAGWDEYNKLGLSELEARGYDGCILKEDDGTFVGFIFNENQVKSATNNNGEYSRENNDIRFSMSDHPPQDRVDNWAKILWPTVDKMKGDLPTEEAALRILQEKGVKVDNANHVWEAVIRARDMIRERNNTVAKNAKDKWRSNEYPILADLRKAFGDNVKIKPSSAFKGEYESDFINTKKGKNTVLSDEAAKKLGITEEELFKEIGKLKGVDMEKAYQDYKTNKTGRKGKIGKLQRELQEQGNFFGAYEIIHGDQPLNDWIIKNQPKVAEEVYQQLMGEPIPEGKAPDWEAVRAKLAEEKAQRPQPSSESSKSSTSSDRLGEGITLEKWKRMQIALERALDEKVSLQEAQKAATDAAMDIPVEKRGGFLHRVANLSKFTDTPTPAYPEGRRSVELERLVEEMSGFAKDIAKSAIIEKIQTRLEQTTKRRTDKGRVLSLEGDQQPTLDKIREITQLFPDTVTSLIESYREMAAKKMSETDDKGNFTGGDPSDYQYEIHMLETFGGLNDKTPEDLAKTYRLIDETARFGRNQVKAIVEANRARYQGMRDELVNIITGGKGLMSSPEMEMAVEKIHEGVIKKTNLMSKDMESLFNMISVNDKRLLADTMLNTDFIVKVHKAYQAEKTEIREASGAIEKIIDTLFGTTGDFSRSNLLMEHFAKEQKTGIFRHQRSLKLTTENLGEIEKWMKFTRVSTEEGRILLRGYDETKQGMTDYQAEALRHQLAEKDQKFKSKLPVSGIGEEFMDAILKTIQDETAKDTVAIPEIHNPGPLTEQPMSKGQALHAWLMWQQPSLKYKMHFNGWTEQSMKQIEKFLSPEGNFKDSGHYKFGQWMVEELRKDLGSINAVCEKLYLSSLTGEINYFPGSFDTKANIGKGSADIADAYSGNATVTPGALYARRYHLKEPKYENALTVFVRHKTQMAHFKSHAEIARDMAAVFGSYDVQTAIRQYHGDETLKYLHAKIQDVVNGGNKNAWKHAMVDAAQGVFARSRIFFNTISMLKQAVGAVSYINKIPPGAFVKYSAEFWTDPIENAKIMRLMMETTYFKNRFGGGMDRDLNLILSKNALGAKGKVSRFNFLDDWGSMPTRVGDAFATIAGGYSVYKYHFNNLIKEGKSESTAHQEAILRWELATERTQQTAAPAALNRLQLGDSVSRTLTTFMGNPILQMNDFLNAASNVVHSRGTPQERYMLAAKTGFTAFVVGGLAMSMISQAAKHGGELDEYEWNRVLKDSLFSPYAAYNMPGMILDSAASWGMGMQTGRSTAIDDLGNIGRTFAKIPDLFSGDMNDEDVYKTIEKTFTALGMLGAMETPGLQALTPLTTNSSAVMRELRRYGNLIFGSDKKKPKESKIRI